jgi:hypothetical protein
MAPAFHSNLPNSQKHAPFPHATTFSNSPRSPIFSLFAPFRNLTGESLSSRSKVHTKKGYFAGATGKLDSRTDQPETQFRKRPWLNFGRMPIIRPENNLTATTKLKVSPCCRCSQTYSPVEDWARSPEHKADADSTPTATQLSEFNFSL